MEHPNVLVVDLDGTLLRSDMLFECFWSAFGSNWLTPFSSIAALSHGKAALKQHLADKAEIAVDTLPYDTEVIAYIEAWRSKGGRTALVTASDQTLAQSIAEHLGLFDEVHGSKGDRNLKGKQKAEFLLEHFGKDCFSYMGDSVADIPVWSNASKAITVNASDVLRAKADAVAKDVEHLTTATKSVNPYLKALRPHQWLKNVLVFLPMLAAHQLDGATFLNSLLAFVSFSLIASSVYVLNDLLDLRADRAHPRKCRRPFASGSIPLAHGTWMGAGLVLSGAGIAFVLGPQFFFVMLVYYLLTVAYSLYLKRWIVIDICVLAGLYTLRIVAGSVATGIPLSVWLLAFSIFFFFSLASVKRQAELVDSVERGKLGASGRGYHIDDLPIISMMAIASGYVSVLVMALYVNSPDVLELYPTPFVLWGICGVLLFWITRTIMLAHRGQMHDDPLVYAAKDRISQICFLVILILATAGKLA